MKHLESDFSARSSGATLIQPDMRRFLESQGMQVASHLAHGALTALMAAETEQWARVIREANVRAD